MDTAYTGPMVFEFKAVGFSLRIAFIPIRIIYIFPQLSWDEVQGTAV